MITVKALGNKEILDSVIHIISSIIPDSTIVLFGSRAKNTQKEYSDYDIAIKSDNLGVTNLVRIQDSINELETLKKIEIIDYNDLDENFKKIVDTEGEILYAKHG